MRAQPRQVPHVPTRVGEPAVGDPDARPGFCHALRQVVGVVHRAVEYGQGFLAVRPHHRFREIDAVLVVQVVKIDAVDRIGVQVEVEGPEASPGPQVRGDGDGDARPPVAPGGVAQDVLLQHGHIHHARVFAPPVCSEGRCS